MSIATLRPLRVGPPVTLVREAGGAGHWVTIGGDEDEPGHGVHIFIRSGGTVEKGPRGLLGHHIGGVASHPSAGKVTHHPVGHDPAGARDHPHYAEAEPRPAVPTGEAGEQEPTKRLGRPYARLHGADQGARHERIGSAVQQAREQAKDAKAATPEAKAADAAVQSQQAQSLDAWRASHHGGRDGVHSWRMNADRTARVCDHCAKVERWRPAGTTSHHGAAGKAIDHDAIAAYMRGIDEVPSDQLSAVADKIERGQHLAHHNQGTRSALAAQIRAHAARPQAERDAETSRRLGLGTGPLTPLGAAPPSGAANVARAADPRATARAAERQGLARTPAGRAQLRAVASGVADDPLHGLAARTALQALDEADKAHGTARQSTAVAQLERRLSENAGALDAAQRRASQTQDKAADTAVAHQQAQADLAAYRASKDRNPNPWAPHLSPPVGDAKDRELQEKATRAQLAHQAVQAQQQASAQQQQAAGTAQAAQPVVHSVGKPGETDDEREQRLLAEYKGHKARFDAIFRSAHDDAGYKERRDLTDRMNDIGGEVQALRDKRAQGVATAKPAIKPLQAPPQPAPAGTPGEITKEHIQAKVAAGEHLTREEKGFVLNGYRMPKPKPEAPIEAPKPAAAEPGARAEQLSGAEGEHAQAMRALRSHYEQLLEDRRAAMSPKARKLYEQRKAQQGASSAPPALTAEHRESLQVGRRLLAQKALDPETHRARVEAAVHKAAARDPYEGSLRGYARHGAAWAERLAHTEAANHYQNASQDLYRQLEDLTNHDKGGALAKAHRHIEALTDHEQRAGGPAVPESDQQARDLLARSQAIGGHYSAAAQRLAARAAEHRAAARGQQRVRESAGPAPRFVAPIAAAAR